MNSDKLFYRHVLLHYFDLKKAAAKTRRLLSEVYGDETPSERTCRVWFERFRNAVDFNVRDKECPEQPKKFQDVDLEELLDENPVHTLQKLMHSDIQLLVYSPELAPSDYYHLFWSIQCALTDTPRQPNVNKQIIRRVCYQFLLLERQQISHRLQYLQYLRCQQTAIRNRIETVGIRLASCAGSTACSPGAVILLA